MYTLVYICYCEILILAMLYTIECIADSSLKASEKTENLAIELKSVN